ncbi:hypothetical protein J6590_006997 [Homalodisca vitripennis]|nr:hypothetical protein J6590_006997 [Homalodisca vitripennis]
MSNLDRTQELSHQVELKIQGGEHNQLAPAMVPMPSLPEAPTGQSFQNLAAFRQELQYIKDTHSLDALRYRSSNRPEIPESCSFRTRAPISQSFPSPDALRHRSSNRPEIP